MKRRALHLKHRAEKKAQKQKGMQNPSGESRYALKRRGAAPKRKGSQRPSWFERFHVAVAPPRA